MSCFESSFKFSAGESKKLSMRVNTKTGDCTEPLGIISPLVAALLVVQDITFTAKQRFGNTGNNFVVEYVGGATAGSEVVTITNLPNNGKKISVAIEAGVSDATQVLAKILAHEAYGSFFTVAITGVNSNPQIVAAATPFATGAGDLVEVEIPAEPANLILDQMTSPAVVVDNGPLSKISVELTDIETNQMIDGPIFVRVYKNGKMGVHVVEGGVKKQVSQGC